MSRSSAVKRCVRSRRSRRLPKPRRPHSSYHERTTTVQLLHASTTRLMGTKLNRVQHTQGRAENGAHLCENFLKGNCDNGSSCGSVHVPQQYLWEIIVPSVQSDTYLYHPGFSIRCYTPGMDALCDIPSSYIYVTRGSKHYVELFNDNGDNFKEKCRLCPVMQEKGYCEKGMDCENVHCCTADLSPFPCIRTHIADEETVALYERLPENVKVRVFQPNNGDANQDFPGSDVLRTAGATQYEKAFREAGGAIPNLKMQHCAHFNTKKLCRLGDGCRFLHVVPVAMATQLDESSSSSQSTLLSMASSDRTTPVGTPHLSWPSAAEMLSLPNCVEYHEGFSLEGRWVRGGFSRRHNPYASIALRCG